MRHLTARDVALKPSHLRIVLAEHIYNRGFDHIGRIVLADHVLHIEVRAILVHDGQHTVVLTRGLCIAHSEYRVRLLVGEFKITAQLVATIKHTLALNRTSHIQGVKTRLVHNLAEIVQILGGVAKTIRIVKVALIILIECRKVNKLGKRIVGVECFKFAHRIVERPRRSDDKLDAIAYLTLTVVCAIRLPQFLQADSVGGFLCA